MLRTQNNVPEVFPNKSRDFQLFCRLYDVAFSGVKQSIDSMQQITDTTRCNSALLELLSDKLGFFTSAGSSDEELRYILNAFPTIIRYKGSQRALNYTVNLYTRLIAAMTTASEISVDIINGKYIIEVSSSEKIYNSKLLAELLRYILPGGYSVDYFETYTAETVTSFTAKSALSYKVTEHDNPKTPAPKPPAMYRTKIVIESDIQGANTALSYTENNEISNIINIATIADPEYKTELDLQKGRKDK